VEVNPHLYYVLHHVLIISGAMGIPKGPEVFKGMKVSW
jgi:hypothetical protein